MLDLKTLILVAIAALRDLQDTQQQSLPDHAGFSRDLQAFSVLSHNPIVVCVEPLAAIELNRSC